jgi:hypothetical protein
MGGGTAALDDADPATTGGTPTAEVCASGAGAAGVVGATACGVSPEIVTTLVTVDDEYPMLVVVIVHGTY